MSTVAQIEQAISQLPPRDFRQLREWINRVPTPKASTFAQQLSDAGWLVAEDEFEDERAPLDQPVKISGEPISETIIRERR